MVDEGYFDAAGIPRLQFDRAAFQAGGAIIDRTVQQSLWPGAASIGDRFRNNFADRVLTVAGLAATVREWDQEDHPTGAVYVDFHSRPSAISTMHAIVRYSGREEAAVRAVREAFAGVDPLVPITIEPLDARVVAALGDRRFLPTVVAGFGGIALLLAAVGVYALVSFAVARTARESAIRMALGAPRRVIRTEAARIALLPATIGLAAGALASLWLGQTLRAQLFHVMPRDPVVILLAAAVMAVAAAGAAFVPTRRAVRIDPAAILRSDLS
jgi:hypothetical protein